MSSATKAMLLSLSHHCEHAAAEFNSLLVSLGTGVAAFVRGIFLSLQAFHAGRRKSEQRRLALWSPALLLAALLLTAGLLWLSTLPLARMGWLDVNFQSLLQLAAFAQLQAFRHLVLWLAPDWFFFVLAYQDKATAETLRALPVLNGLRQWLWRWIRIAACCAGLFALVLVLGPMVQLPLAAVLGTLLLSWQLVVILLLGGGATLALLGSGAYLWSCLKPFLRLYDFDPILCLLATVAVLVRMLSVASVGGILKIATVLYYSCTLLTAEFMAPYSERLSAEDWRRFQRRFCWEMFGFGLPVCLLLEYAPVALVLLLQLIQGASTTLLLDLLPQVTKPAANKAD